MCDDIQFHGWWSMVWLDDQGLGRTMIGKLVTRKIWEEGMWIDCSEQAKKSEDICFPCECSPKGELSRGGF